MDFNFEGRVSEDYELFLPRPIFSSTYVSLSLSTNQIYSDVIHIINKGEGIFRAEIEVVGVGLIIDSSQLVGNDSTILYHIDTKEIEPGEKLSAFLLLTYLGGEQRIEFDVEVREDFDGETANTLGDEVSGRGCISSEVVKGEKHNEQSEEVKVSSLAKVDSSIRAGYKFQHYNYKVQLNKRAYDIDERARITILNHDLYPINVKVIDISKGLECNVDYVTVNEIGFLDVGIKKRLFGVFRPIKKTMNSPILKHEVVIEITSEEGRTKHRIPLTYTNYWAPSVEGEITTEKAFKKVGVQIQKLYIRYLIYRQKPLLKEAVKLCEEAMAYNSTDINLRLFYMMLLIDMSMERELSKQVNSLSQYCDYYREQGQEEYSDIIEALSIWLEGDSLVQMVDQWPKTKYRQLFRYRVFRNKVNRFKDFEDLYEAGIHSVYLYAETVYHLNSHPEIPNHRSTYYQFILRWAMTKGWIMPEWTKKLSQSYYQLINNDIVDSPMAFELYTHMPNEGILKLLGTLLAQEEDHSSEAYGVYYEALRQEIFIKDCVSHYVKSAYTNRLKIDVAYSHITLLHAKLSHNELVYLYIQLSKLGPMDASGVQLVKRYYKEVLDLSIHKRATKDEIRLVAIECEAVVDSHQWVNVKDLLRVPFLSKLLKDYESVVEQIVAMGVENGDFKWLEAQLPKSTVIKLLDEKSLRAYFDYLIKGDRDKAFNHTIGILLYNKGQHDDQVLTYLAMGYKGSLVEMIDFYHVLRESGIYVVEFTQKLLYKAIVVRQHQDLVLDVYIDYRNRNKRDIVFEAMNRFFSAQVLIEEMYVRPKLVSIFEEDLADTSIKMSLGLALIKLYEQLGINNEVISTNIIKNAIKNGIIFPWFGDLALPIIQESQFRKAAFFSYHSKSQVVVTLYYRCDGQETYTKLKMKHVAFGMHIGYFVAFYQEHISYYYEELNADGVKEITESGIYIHERIVTPENDYNSFDTINTVLMSRFVEDDKSVFDVVKDYASIRAQVRDEMILL